jgi:hypothetical protein
METQSSGYDGPTLDYFGRTGYDESGIMRRLSSVSVRSERPECPTIVNQRPIVCAQGPPSPSQLCTRRTAGRAAVVPLEAAAVEVTLDRRAEVAPQAASALHPDRDENVECTAGLVRPHSDLSVRDACPFLPENR